jgi:hypothetical protein
MAVALNHEDIMELKRVFDDRYVLQSDCNEKQENINKKFANDDKRIDLILAEQKQMRKETKSGLKFNNWLTTAVLGAIVVAVIGFYFFAT